MRRVLLVATTTGYQTRAFGDAAARVGVELVFATDRCAVLDDPWRDSAIPVRFHAPAGSVRRIAAVHRAHPFAAVMAVGDRPAVLAARARAVLGLQGHSADAAVAARHKLETRTRLRSAGLPTPAFSVQPLDTDVATLSAAVTFPAVVKPVSLSGSRGVMRVNDETELVAAVERLRALLARPDVRVERDPAHALLLVESFIEGHEFALEGLMTDGALRTLAIFDKPDPLDGPFFEETIYLAGGEPGEADRRRIEDAVTAAARAIGLQHGPIHAECRVQASGVYVLEVAARPIGGICARSLRFEQPQGPTRISLEELLLRHALGEDVSGWQREAQASGVMMIPIPRRGVYKGVTGVEAAREVAGIDDVVITAKLDQLLLPLPEGASYLGFIFAHADTPGEADRALRVAHGRLAFTVVPDLPVLQSSHG
ncbi:MAG: ATP-grasp domain-containing protein [Vicinamibacterales bacterium]